ncbi:MAG: twin-arginine translocase TatA/TatE family subunit [Pirellulales bacterium]|nr:twin-arginine translocase TatA/TatE family subunit [Pirellulales bacterium]
MLSDVLSGPLGFLPFVGGVGTSEWIIIGVVAVLLFGKRLPEVGRSLGKSLMEFKKGMQGIEDEIRNAGNISSTSTRSSAARYQELEDRDEPTAPKFEPPKSEPRPETAATSDTATA